MSNLSETRDCVGPVLHKTRGTDAVVAAICELNEGAIIVDRGAYLRVLVRDRCVLTRKAIEKHGGHPFELPADLELLMSSFKGRIFLSEDEVVWSMGEVNGP